MPDDGSQPSERTSSVTRLAAHLLWRPDVRGKARLVSVLPFRGIGTFNLPWGRMELALGDRIQRQMAFGTYERPEVRAVRHHVRPGETVIDVGAHVGYFTTLMASLVGREGRVIAVEPDPRNFASLRKNIMMNRLTWVDAIEAAASDVDDSATSFIPGPQGETGWGSLAPVVDGDPIAVASRRLDTLLQDQGIQDLDFVKIDAEGWEPRVLVGLEPFLLKPSGPTILAELSSALLTTTGNSVEQICDYLSGFGYERRMLRGRAGQMRHNSLFLKA